VKISQIPIDVNNQNWRRQQQQQQHQHKSHFDVLTKKVSRVKKQRKLQKALRGEIKAKQRC